MVVLGEMETNVAVFWMRFRQIPWETSVDHLSEGAPADGATLSVLALRRFFTFSTIPRNSVFESFRRPLERGTFVE